MAPPGNAYDDGTRSGSHRRQIDSLAVGAQTTSLAGGRARLANAIGEPESGPWAPQQAPVLGTDFSDNYFSRSLRPGRVIISVQGSTSQPPDVLSRSAAGTITTTC